MNYRFLSHDLVFQTRSYYRLLNVPALARLANNRCAASCLRLNFLFVLRLGSAFCFVTLNRGNFDLVRL